MRQILRIALFFATLLLPAAASAQCSFPTPIPANVVIGRLGIGPGPCQAIPFSTLSAQLTGAAITLNSGNGQTAPGAMSGGNTYSFGATTDTPRFAGIGLGGAAPATGLEVYNAPVSPTGNGQLVAGSSSTNGAVYGGQGSLYDAALANKSAAVALGIPTGTQNVVLQGTLTAASLTTSGTIAGSLCATSAGVVLYEATLNCFAVSGISVVSGKTLTVDNSIELAGTDGTKFTFPGLSDTVATLGQTQTFNGNKTFSGTLNITGTGEINGTAFGTFATQNYATPPAIGGTTPAAGSFSTLTASTPVGLTSGGTNGASAMAARAAAGLNIDELTSHGDSNYAIASTDRTVATSATLTSPRTWTLPAASTVNAGQHLYVQDFKGFVSGTNTITIPRNGSDTINGGTGSQVINNANGGFLFISDGVSNWSAQALGAQATSGVASINGQTGNPSIVSGTGITVSTTGGNISVATGTQTPTGATTARSLPNLFGDFLTVKDFGATGTADDTATFQAAIDASCSGHLSGLVNQIFPIIIPTGIYNITQLNATNCGGFTMMGMGSANGSNGGTILRKTASSTVNAILDLTGSISGASLKNFFIQGSLTDGDTPYAQEGILMANSNLTTGTGNVNLIENVAISGRFSIAGIYMYGVCCSVATQLTGQNANPSNANATGWSYLNTNVNSATSSYATIATGAQGASGFSCYRCEMHAFTSSSGASGRALALDGSRDFLYSSGILASANAAYTTVLSGNTTQLTFENTQWYTDQGPTAPFAVGSSGGTAKNVVFINPDVTVGSGGGLTSLTGFASGRVINGIININGTVSNYHNGDIGTAPVASSCGASPTVTGSDTGGTVTESGTNTGCTITFATPFSISPACSFANNLSVATFQSGATATTLTFAHTSATTLKISWNCSGP